MIIKKTLTGVPPIIVAPPMTWYLLLNIFTKIPSLSELVPPQYKDYSYE